MTEETRNKAVDAVLIYLILAAAPGSCYGFFVGTLLVLELYRSKALGLWLALLVSFLPYVAVAFVIGRQQRGAKWPRFIILWVVVVALLIMLQAFRLMSALFDMSVGIFSGHKETLFWGSVMYLYCAGVAAGMIGLGIGTRVRQVGR
jgi:hypothetical protein